ncbi:MAG: hypothetical protein K0R44_37 [Thermomicrobiales bacterium]|jgi:hypothetical protein|nr:hypothetical protein [Thermomicrobiales bacterium]MDF3014812.1 hypothetical protein [Thermomicrobiales bacterium]
MARQYACEQLTTEARVDSYCSCSLDGLAGTNFTISDIIDAASDFVFLATGGRVRGRCESTVRPCADRSCMCGHPSDACGCCRLDAIALPGDMVDVISVQIDGTTLDPSEYGFIDGAGLVRVGEHSTTWPGCQYLSRPDGQEGTFSITYEHGLLPFVGVMAATEIACELLTALTGKTSRLDPRVITAVMDGVTVELDPTVLGMFDWTSRLAAQYPALGPRPIVWSPEVDDGWALHTTSF